MITAETIARTLIVLIFGGGLALSIQRGVKAYRDIKGGNLADSGTVLDRLERENTRVTAVNAGMHARVDAAEAEAEAERKLRHALEMKVARLEVQLIRAGIEPEGGPTHER